MAKLTDTRIRAAIRTALATGQRRKLYDSDGLYLILRPQESICGAWWRQRYWWAGKERLLSCGVYPDVTLATARARGEAIRKQAANDVDPSSARKQVKAARRQADERYYKTIVKEWLGVTGKARGWTAPHLDRITRRQEVHFMPWLGTKDIGDITTDDVLSCLRRLRDRNLIDTARRALSETDAIFRYARQHRYIATNPIADLRGPDTLPAVRVQHHAALTDPDKVGALLRAIDGYHGGFVVKSALRFAPLVFVRPGELRFARWEELKLDGTNPEWRIPAARMKMREAHIVPLSTQAISILRELQPVTGPDGLVFPQARNSSRPISENTLNVALQTLGYSHTQQTPHGFRSTASTLLNEQGFNSDWIERQLAHGERNKVRASYNSAQHLPERRKMMQAWADYLDGLKAPKEAMASPKAA